MQPIGSFSPGDRIFFVTDLMAHATNAQGEVLIFSQRIGLKATCLLDQITSPRAHCARYHRDAIQARKGAPIHVLRRDVLESLPARHDVYAIADLSVAGDSADYGIIKTTRQSPHRMWRKQSVGV